MTFMNAKSILNLWPDSKQSKSLFDFGLQKHVLIDLFPYHLLAFLASSNKVGHNLLSWSERHIFEDA